MNKSNKSKIYIYALPSRDSGDILDVNSIDALLEGTSLPCLDKIN